MHKSYYILNHFKVTQFLIIFTVFSFLDNRKAMKGLGVGIALVVFAQFTANTAITSYSVMIFEKSGTTFDPYISAIVLAVVLILGSFLGTYFADILGRRILNFISLAGAAIGLFVISLYQYLKLNGFELSAFEWVPIASLSFVIFISSAGIMKLSLLCSLENLPPKVSCNCGMFSLSFTCCHHHSKLSLSLYLSFRFVHLAWL